MSQRRFWTGHLPVQVKGITIWVNLLSAVVSKLGADGCQTQLNTLISWPCITYQLHGKQTLCQICNLGKIKEQNSTDISRHSLHIGVTESGTKKRWLQGNFKEHNMCSTQPLGIQSAHKARHVVAYLRGSWARVENDSREACTTCKQHNCSCMKLSTFFSVLL